MAASVPPSMIAALGTGAVAMPTAPAPVAVPEQDTAEVVQGPEAIIASRKNAVKKALDSAGGQMT